MSISLTGDDDTARPAASGSPLANLRARRQQLLDAQVLDLPVPRWDDPVVVVRYRPVTAERVRKASRVVDKAKSGDDLVDAHADLLIEACVGVFAVLDGKHYSLDPAAPDGEWTRFDDALAANLGVENPTARKVLRALYLTDGDVTSAANEVMRWSGFTVEGVDKEFEGE